MAEAVCVGPDHIERIWPHASELVRKAILKTGLSDFHQVEESILSGRSLLWLAWDGNIKAAASTALTKANGNLVCEIVACGGDDLSEWVELIRAIEQFAKNEGCNAMRIIGRKGWQRVLQGYDMKHVILEKAL